MLPKTRALNDLIEEKRKGRESSNSRDELVCTGGYTPTVSGTWRAALVCTGGRTSRVSGTWGAALALSQYLSRLLLSAAFKCVHGAKNLTCLGDKGVRERLQPAVWGYHV